MANINMSNIFNRGKFSDLYRTIRECKIDDKVKETLTNYLKDIESGKRNNAFLDDDFLVRVFTEYLYNLIQKDSTRISFDDLIEYARYFFPCGENTADLDIIKEIFIKNISYGEMYFNSKFFSLFSDKRNYIDLINIIREKGATKRNIDHIINYAIRVSSFCVDEDVLKRDLINFIFQVEYCNDINALIEDSITEAKKRAGVYPLDERVLEEITEKARRAEAALEKLDTMETRVGEASKRISDEIRKAKIDIAKVQEEAEKAIKSLYDTIEAETNKKIDDMLKLADADIRSKSDGVIQDLYAQAREKIQEIRLSIMSISDTASKEIARIQNTTSNSIDRLKDTVEKTPELKELLREVGDEQRVVDILTKIGTASGVAPAVTMGLQVPTNSGLHVPGNDRVIIPANASVELSSPSGGVLLSSDDKILYAYDRAIPFEKRMSKILKEMDRCRANGEIFHEKVEEIIRCIISGDWPYVWGPSGCGKSYAVDQAARLLLTELAENGKITDVYSIMAYNDPHGRFRATQAFVAVYYGKLLFLDEFDNGNVDTHVCLNTLYSALLKTMQQPNKKSYITFAEDMTVPVHPNFRMISAGNTNGGGENLFYSSRGKIDEAVQERQTPIEFKYDNVVEGQILKEYSAWYKIFKEFREACTLYAKRNGLPSVPGMITTRDASSIAQYILDNSKSLQQVLEHKFIQVKEDEYLSTIIEYFQHKYDLPGLPDILNKPLREYNDKELARLTKDTFVPDKPLKNYTDQDIAKQLVYYSRLTVAGRK